MSEKFLKNERSKKAAGFGLAMLGALAFVSDDAKASFSQESPSLSEIREGDIESEFERTRQAENLIKEVEQLLGTIEREKLVALQAINSTDIPLVELTERQKNEVSEVKIYLGEILKIFNNTVSLAGINGSIFREIRRDNQGEVANQVRELVKFAREVLTKYDRRVIQEALIELIEAEQK